jgi:hypothetical protein
MLPIDLMLIHWDWAKKNQTAVLRENWFSHVEDGASDERGDCIDCSRYLSSSCEVVLSAGLCKLKDENKYLSWSWHSFCNFENQVLELTYVFIQKWMSKNSNVLFQKCLWFKDQSITGRAYLLSDQQVGCASTKLNFLAIKTNLHLVYRVSNFLMIWLLAEEYLLSSIQLTWKLGLQGDGCWFKDCREAFKPVFACIIDDSMWLSLAWQVPSTMNIFQWNNIIKEVSRCRVSIHETDSHDHNIRN